MTLLASQIPVLYCLMYFQSSRRSARDQASLILDALTPQRRWLRSSRTVFDDSKEQSEIQKKPAGNGRGLPGTSASSEDRSWTWHKKSDPQSLCNARYFDFTNTTLLHRRLQKGFAKDNDCLRPETGEVLTDRFMTVDELRAILPDVVDLHHDRETKPAKRYKVENARLAEMHAFIDSNCASCNTEIGYEVLTHVRDFKGVNHTVINFQDAYQFIPAGRCLNENSPCGGGRGGRCIQVYRAQWTLVWATPSGSRLVAHQVPSHCQCLNVGTALDATASLKKSHGSLDSEPASIHHGGNTQHSPNRPQPWGKG